MDATCTCCGGKYEAAPEDTGLCPACDQEWAEECERLEAADTGLRMA